MFKKCSYSNNITVCIMLHLKVEVLNERKKKKKKNDSVILLLLSHAVVTFLLCGSHCLASVFRVYAHYFLVLLFWLVPVFLEIGYGIKPFFEHRCWKIMLTAPNSSAMMQKICRRTLHQRPSAGHAPTLPTLSASCPACPAEWLHFFQGEMITWLSQD